MSSALSDDELIKFCMAQASLGTALRPIYEAIAARLSSSQSAPPWQPEAAYSLTWAMRADVRKVLVYVDSEAGAVAFESAVNMGQFAPLPPSPRAPEPDPL